MIREDERRKNRRLPIRTWVCCRKIGTPQNHTFGGNIIDISPDGVLMEGEAVAAMYIGDMCSIDMDIPDSDSAGQFAGKVSAYARVVRIVELEPERKSSRKHIALQFCTRPQFEI
ncbi:MAG: hypothetical protein WC770_03545 [Phycisphaerae bacterium]|jgi:hypothetical protein